MYIPWLNAAERIGELMETGQFATNKQRRYIPRHCLQQLPHAILYPISAADFNCRSGEKQGDTNEQCEQSQRAGIGLGGKRSHRKD